MSAPESPDPMPAAVGVPNSTPGTQGSMPGPGQDPSGPLSPAYRGITIAVLALVTIVAFESMAVSTAMPGVAHGLHAVRNYGFAFSVMLTAQLLGIVLAGVWTDRSGPIPGTFAGQAMVAAGSAICGFAHHFDLFLVGRFLTGLGGGLLVVMLYVIAGRVYPEEIRPKLFTYVSAAWVLPALLGPPVAAFLTDTFTWRWVFWIVVAPTILTMIGMNRARHRMADTSLEHAVSSRDHHEHVHAAWAGLGIALAAGLVQYGTSDLRFEWSPRTILAVVGVVGVFVTAPLLVPRGTWRMARGIPSVMLSRALFCAAFYGGVSYVPLFLHDQRHASLQLAGLAVAVGACGWAVGAVIQGRADLDRHRTRFVWGGAAILTSGFLLIAAIAALNWRGWLSVFGLFLAGVAMGLGVTSTTVLALELAPVEDHASTSSSLQLSDVLGSVLGIAASTAAFAAFHVRGEDNDLFGGIFLGLALIAAVAVPAGQRIRT